MSNWQDTYKKLKKRKEEMDKTSGSLDASYNTATPSVKDINGLRNPDSAYNTLDVSSVLLGTYTSRVQPTVTNPSLYGMNSKTIMTNETKEPTVKSENKVQTVNADGYRETGKTYGDYWYQEYGKRKDEKIYEKNGKYYLYSNGTYQDVDKVSYMTDKKTDKKILQEAKKEGYKGNKSSLAHISDQLKLDTENLSKDEYKEYESDLKRQQDKHEKELARKSEVQYSGAGLKGSLGTLKTYASNVENKVDDEIATPLKYAKDNYEAGKLNNKLALEYYNKMEGKSNNVDELKKKVDTYNKFNKDLLEEPGALGTAIQQANTTVESLKHQGVASTVLGLGGAVVGALLTKTPQGMLTGAKTGGMVGYTLGSTPYTYKLEAGNQYQALTEMGVPDKVAKKYSKITGVINAGIESGENILDLATLGISAAKGTSAVSKEAVNSMVEDYGESTVKEWLTKKIGEESANKIVNIAKTGVASYAQNIGSEALEESLQESTAVGTERLATKEAGIERKTTARDDLNRILEAGKTAAISSALTSPLTSIGGAIVTHTVNKVEAKLQNKVKNITETELNNEIKTVIENTEKENKTTLSTQEVKQIQADVMQQVQDNGITITNDDIAPFKTSNITTQETNSNSFVETPNNTINNEKPITSKTNIKDYIGIEDYNTKGGENKISDGLIREIQYKTRKANENKSNIEIVSTNDISKNEKNGGYRTSEQISKLTNDIKNEGILEPIEVKRNSDGSVEVVNGNHRLEIAKQLGLKEVPVKYVNSDIENIDNSQNILYNKENEKDLNYINEDYKNGIRNNKEAIENNDRSGNIKEYSISNSVEAENERTAGKNDKISNKISRYNDGSSSTSTYAQNTGIKELDNSSFSFNERYDDLKKITKEFNKVKSEISGIKEDLAPIKGYMKQETSLYDQTNFDNLEKQGIAPVKESSNPNYNSWEELMLDLYKYKNQKEKEAITSQKTSNETKMSGTEDIAPVKQPTLKVEPEMNVAFDKFAQSFIDKQNELKERKKTKPKSETKAKLGRAWDTFQETMINRNRQIDNLAKETGNSEIKFKGDRMNNISGEIGGDIFTAQTDNYGNAIGKSLDAPFAEARNLGIDAYLDGYLKNLSNVERHGQGKGSSVVSAEQSKALIKAYEERYPVLKNLANDVYTYNQNMLNNAVENGIIDNEFRDRLISMYGKYVPFYENDIGTNPVINMSPDEIRGSKPIKRAKGGSDANLQGVEQAMMKQTYAWKNAIVKNDLYKEIVNSINDKVNIGADTRENPTLLSDSLYSDESGKYLTAYVDGKQQTVKIGDELFSELNRDLDKQIRNYEEKLSLVTKPLQKLSQIRGQILTTYNPSFGVATPFKDIQDALLNTKNLKGYAKNLTATIQDSKRAKNINTYANDYKTITGQDITSVTNPSSLTGTAKKLYKKYQDGVMWNRFITSYGTNATGMKYGNNNVDTKTKNKGFLNKIANLNNYMEVMFRYPEFKATLKEGKSFTEALYNAREITTNFGRGGAISKAINRNGATFFNASIQGLDKFVRNFSGENGARGFVGAVSKAVMLGMAPSVLNHLSLGGLSGDADDDYKALPDYVKDNYYLFKRDNGEFARIPKGRMISVLGSAARRTLELAQGEKNAFDGFLSNAESQVGSTNPLKENIFSPLIQAYGSENGEAWYGGDLVPSRLQDLPAAEQYDESTDELSKLIGNVFNISPYKVNYVIDQYSGGLGDILLPMASKKAFNDSDSFGDYLLAPIKDKFLVNSTDDNKYAGELFDMSDELTTKANSSKATDEDKLKNQYINSVKSDMSKLYQEKREIQNSNLSKSEKYKQVQKIQDQINQMSKDALNTYEKGKYESNYASFGDTEFYKYKNSEGEEFWKQIKDDEADDLNSMELTASEKNKYFISKTKIGDIAGVYKESKKGLDEDDNSYNEAIAELSDDKKESIIDTILKADLPDEAKEYLYSKNYSSEKSLDKITKAGTSINTYLTFEKDTLKFEADKDDDGKKISGSLNNKYEKYLLNSKLSDTDKINLYEHAVLSGFNEEDKYKDYKTIKAAGVDIDTWLGFDSHAFEADKDKNGKAVSGSKKKKVISYVNSLDLSIPQKAMMIKTKYSSFHNYNNQIVKFVEGLDVSFNDKVKMIKSLNMKVSNDGTVSW